MFEDMRHFNDIKSLNVKWLGRSYGGCEMVDVEFREPKILSRGKKGRFMGVAFVEGFNEAVGFEITAWSWTGEEKGITVGLKVEATQIGKIIYDFFNKIFKKHSRRVEGLIKSYKDMVASWHVKAENWGEIVKEVGEKMNCPEWKEAFKSMTF